MSSQAQNLLRTTNGELRTGVTHNALRSNLAIALYLVPRKSRKDAFLFYHFCHTLDEVIDSSLLSLSEKKTLLQSYERALENTDSIFLSEIRNLIECHQMDRSLFLALFEGMKMDLTLHRYSTFEDLRLYAWRVAATVGLISAKLFGAAGEDVRDYAEQLSMALQLTNILRDVAEDARRSRIYLPLEELKRFHVSEEEILQGTPSPQATHLFDYQAERALSYFAKATRAWEKMPLLQRRLMRPARLMEAIYRTLLEAMQRDRYDLFHRRYRVGALKKITLALHLLFSSEKK